MRDQSDWNRHMIAIVVLWSRLDKVTLMRKIAGAALIMALLAGGSTANYTESTEEKTISFNIEQKVKGNGYFKCQYYALMPNALGNPGKINNGTEYLGYIQGSGFLDRNSLISGESWESYGWDEASDDEYDDALSRIQTKEKSNTSYSPTLAAFGTSNSSLVPVRYNSLIEEKTCIKNRESGTSMSHEVEQAHALDKELDASVTIYPNITSMNISENVWDGRTHIGVLHGDPNMVDMAWPEEDIEDQDDEESSSPEDTSSNEESSPQIGASRLVSRKPLIAIDEDYFGTYHIDLRMNVIADANAVTEDDDWMPCCSGGWEDMDYLDKMHYGASANEIFNCTGCKAASKGH